MFRPRLISMLGLLALVPVVAFLLRRSVLVVLSLACVLLIVTSLWLMFSPEGGRTAPTP